MEENNKVNIFDSIYRQNLWQDPDSKSGTGSNLIQTAVIRVEIPKVVKQFNIKTMLDAPCGDYFWMKEIKNELKVNLQQYIGADIVSDIIANNNAKYADAHTKFIKLDIVNETPPKVDLIFTRDCLVHLLYKDIYKALKQYKKSGSTYLLTTTFTDNRLNKEIKTGSWRPINLSSAPFNFPEPILIINENCTEDNGMYPDKSLGLWLIEDIPLVKIKINLLSYSLSLKKEMIYRLIKKGCYLLNN